MSVPTYLLALRGRGRCCSILCEQILVSHCISCQRHLTIRFVVFPRGLIVEYSSLQKFQFTRVYSRECRTDSIKQPVIMFHHSLDFHLIYLSSSSSYHSILYPILVIFVKHITLPRIIPFLFISEGWAFKQYPMTIIRPSIAVFLSCIPTRLIVEYYYITLLMNILLFEFVCPIYLHVCCVMQVLCYRVGQKSSPILLIA